MKKVVLVSLAFCAFLFSNAQEKSGSSKLTKNGLFIDTFVGTATTDSSSSTTFSSTSGIGGGLKFGNIWYFGSNDMWKPGFKTTWLRAGAYFGDEKIKFQGTVLNVGFANIIKFTNEIGIEANVNAGYNVLLSLDNATYTDYYGNSYVDSNNDFAGGGIMFNPEVKFRYNVLAVGLDFVFSNITSFESEQFRSGTSSYYSTVKTGFTAINLTIGAKF